MSKQTIGWQPARLLNSRRTVTALGAILSLTVIALVNKVDTSMSIATIAAAMCAGNAFQRKGQPDAE